MTRPRSQMMVLMVCLLVVLVLVGLAVIVGTVGSPADGTIAFELRKYVIQFLLIVALGAVVAFLVEDQKRRAESDEKERRQDRELADRRRHYDTDIVTSLLDRLDVIYRAVKRRRRLFRLVPLKDLNKQAYVDAMLKLSDDRQDVVKLASDMEVLEGWLPELKPVRQKIKDMDDYLAPIEDEWEAVASKSDDTFQAELLKELKEFHSKENTQESNFRVFRMSYNEARRDLIALLATKRIDRPSH